MLLLPKPSQQMLDALRGCTAIEDRYPGKRLARDLRAESSVLNALHNYEYCINTD